ncbi:LysE family translocator [Rhizobium wuzhouense]|uniref:Amino acid transporter n=1 Tax=Rhizobium wuzhouense TaxID=1986026 RepID=A0ABX5NRX6_9HYPH|nr:LysE family translocator [Rhizobium wuzhouense]PYB74083.1 amino acid transporter [Rhizobium wuzhouense]
MQVILENLPQVFSAYVVYLVAVLSPGPATMAIASTSLGEGRRHGFAMAAGVFCGSMSWALAASAGLATVLTHYAHALTVMRIVGGLYLLYLAWRAFRSAASATDPLAKGVVGASYGRTFLRGYAIHLTNPKAIFAWLAILSLGLPVGATGVTVAVIVAGCLVTGFTVFMGYAWLLSLPGALKAYRSARRYIDGTLAVLFAAAGARLLLQR